VSKARKLVDFAERNLIYRVNKGHSKAFERDSLKINSVVLFGSLARGEGLPWSDVDLLLISRDFSGMRKEDRIHLLLDKWDYMRPLEPICLSPDEISEENSLIWEICIDGIPVVDDGTFRELKT